MYEPARDTPVKARITKVDRMLKDWSGEGNECEEEQKWLLRCIYKKVILKY